MSQSLHSYSFFEKRKLGNLLAPVVNTYGSPRASLEAAHESARIIESKTKQEPKEWLYWYVLGDLYLFLQQYTKASISCEKCYELKPRDPRSAYSLASILRELTNARHRDNPDLDAVNAHLAEMGAPHPISPQKCQEALNDIGLTIQEAAKRAMVFFQEALVLGVNDSDAKHLQGILNSMNSAFPELKEIAEVAFRIKSRYRSKSIPEILMDFDFNALVVPGDVSVVIALVNDHARAFFKDYPNEFGKTEYYHYGRETGLCLVYGNIKVAIFQEDNNPAIHVRSGNADAFSGTDNLPTLDRTTTQTFNLSEYAPAALMQSASHVLGLLCGECLRNHPSRA